MLTLAGKPLAVPVLQGGMGVGVSLGGLAGAVAACGGMGCISTADTGYREPDFAHDPYAANLRALKKEIAKAKEIAGGAGLVAINAMVATQNYADADAMLAASDAYFEHLAKQDLLFQAVAETENLAPTDAEIADWGVATESNEYFITEQRRQSLAEAQSGGDEWEKHGTIGAVARDAEGNIAAGTSTGGITNQMHGRVGDSPLPGCGTFANQSTVAVSCTGIGEAFIKVVAAHQVSDRVRFAGENVEDAATATLDEVAAHHGDGGMIVLPAVGRGVVAYNSEMMNFGYRSAQGGKVQG